MLWLVGMQPDFDKPDEWQFCGLYDEQGMADAECKDCRYFVAPVKVNFTVPDIRSEFPGSYRPSLAKPNGNDWIGPDNWP